MLTLVLMLLAKKNLQLVSRQITGFVPIIFAFSLWAVRLAASFYFTESWYSQPWHFLSCLPLWTYPALLFFRYPVLVAPI
jgi:hypothetical protein